MAVSLFASCAPKLLQKSHALTNLANRFTWPNPSNEAVRPLQLPSERGGGAVRGTCCSAEPATSPRRRARCFSRSPSCPRLPQQQAQGKCIRFTSIPFHVTGIQVLFLGWFLANPAAEPQPEQANQQLR